MPDEVGIAGGLCLLAGVVWMIVGGVLTGRHAGFITPAKLFAFAPLGFLLWLLGCVLLVIYALGGGEYR